MSERGENYEPFVYETNQRYDRVSKEAYVRSEFFDDLNKLNEDLSTKVYDSVKDLHYETLELSNSINQEAIKFDILQEYVSIVGKSEDIRYPRFSSDLAQNCTVAFHESDEDQDVAAVSGVLNRFTILPEHHDAVTAIDENGEEIHLEDIYIPRIYYMVQTANVATPNSIMSAAYQCKFGDVQIEFSKDYSEQAEDRVIEVVSSISDTHIGEEIQLFEDSLRVSDDPEKNAHGAREASTYVHRLLNKSDIVDKDMIEDLLVDVVNLRIPSDVKYNVETPYVLISGNLSDKHADYDYIFPDTDSEDTSISYQNLKPLTISCLPRSYVAPHDSSECVIKHEQKALYMTFLDNDANLYHIPLESIQSLEQIS